ncbi:nuclear transport factor 2 family protein [Kordia sp.]|uniref:nuclear transport factor 2 family protein n=1 Tax=Kordia sp. TaxID=1965332 RepID=UPI003D2734F9
MKTLKFFPRYLLLFILFSNPLFSQDKDGLKSKSSLEHQITKMDSLLFNVAFNKCDLELYKKIMSSDLEFYDDRSGLNVLFEKEVASFNDRCSKPVSITRKLVNSSAHILGDYGAVQTGVHEFYVDGKKVERAKFITVWERKDNTWIVKRVISYDHEEARN